MTQVYAFLWQITSILFHFLFLAINETIYPILPKLVACHSFLINLESLNEQVCGSKWCSEK